MTPKTKTTKSKTGTKTVKKKPATATKKKASIAMTTAEAAEYIGPDMAEEFADFVNSLDENGKPGPKRPAPDCRDLKADQDVLTLQMPESFGGYETAWDVERYLGMVVCNIVGFFRDKKKRGQVWGVFLAHDRPHVENLPVWLGFSKNVPADLVQMVKTMVEKQGAHVGMEYGNVGANGFKPFLALTDEGLEVPPEDDCFIDDCTVEDLGPVVRRAFRLI
jgi:hypothetical protein